MASLTEPQIELLRRLEAGRSLYSCSDIPRFLEEVILLSRLRLIAIDMDGSPTLTDDGIAYLRVVEISEFAQLQSEGTSALPSTLPIVETPDGPLPLGRSQAGSATAQD